MTVREIGLLFLGFVVIFIIGQIWFHLIDGIVEKVKGIFRKKEPWHPLPENDDEKRRENEM